jgi:predicted RNA binding protein YcfA (HicA-like mRNA interferase family)
MATTVRVPKPLRQIAKLAVDQGWRVETTKRNHIQFKAPDGIHIVTTSGTPSDWRSNKNLTAQLRRNGLDLPHTGILG